MSLSAILFVRKKAPSRGLSFAAKRHGVCAVVAGVEVFAAGLGWPVARVAGCTDWCAFLCLCQHTICQRVGWAGRQLAVGLYCVPLAIARNNHRLVYVPHFTLALGLCEDWQE